MCGSVSGGGVCYSGDSVGSVAVYFCDDGYTLEGDTTRECLSSGLWNGSTPQCILYTNGSPTELVHCHELRIFFNLEGDEAERDIEKDSSWITAVIVGVICSVIGVVLGVMGLCIILQVKGRLFGPTSSSPPPLPPPVIYEEVEMARKVKSSIQLTCNEAYGPANKDNIPTSHNTAYGQVQAS